MYWVFGKTELVFICTQLSGRNSQKQLHNLKTLDIALNKKDFLTKLQNKIWTRHFPNYVILLTDRFM